MKVKTLTQRKESRGPTLNVRLLDLWGFSFPICNTEFIRSILLDFDKAWGII